GRLARVLRAALALLIVELGLQGREEGVRRVHDGHLPLAGRPLRERDLEADDPEKQGRDEEGADPERLCGDALDVLAPYDGEDLLPVHRSLTRSSGFLRGRLP